jgi:parallel beta-helix repeat protein
MTRHPFRALGLFTSTALLLVGCGGGGGGGGGGPAPAPDPLLSSLTVGHVFGTPADGATSLEVRAEVRDALGTPLRGHAVRLEVSGFANAVFQPAATDALGVATGEVRTLVGEKKSIVAVVDPGPNEVRLGPVTAEFLRIQSNWRFVRTSGSDASDGRTPLTAWATPAFAVTQLVPGDVLFIGAGTYAGPLVLDQVASSGAPIVVRGDREGAFTGDAGEVLVDAGAQTVGVHLDGAAWVTLRGLSVRGADSAGGPPGNGSGIFASGAVDCSVLDCRVYENSRGIELENTTRAVVEGNRVSANLGDGLVLSGTLETDLARNLIYVNGDDGVELGLPSQTLTIRFNTFYRNDGAQLNETVSGSTGSVHDNVLSEGKSLGFSLSGGTQLSPTSNLAWLHTGNNPTPGLVADPLFADPFGPDGILGGVGAEDDDFRVQVASPALDAGLGDARDQVLRLGGPLSTLTSRVDGVADGEAPDLTPSNLGFHETTPVDPFVSLESLGARVVTARPGDTDLFARAWNRSTGIWAPARKPLHLNSDVRWLVQRVSPNIQPAEIVAGLADTGNGTQLFVRVWNGRRWSDDTPTVLSTAIPAANADERGFDVEFEEQSGHALLAYADGGQNVVWQEWIDGRWTAPQEIFTPVLTTGTVLWVDLVPRAGTDEMALIALGENKRLFASIWDGSSWTLPQLLGDSVVVTHDWKAFDAAWESQSGDLLVSWGYNLFAEQTRFATLSNGVWVTGQHNSTDALGLMVDFAADPTSDRIAGIFGEGDVDDDVGVSMWDGNAWTNTAEFTLTGQPEQRAFEVGWLGNTGLAFAIWRDTDLTGVFQWALFTSTGWRKQGQVSAPGVGKIQQCQARNVPGTGRVMLLVLDEAGSVFVFEHDGSGWALGNAGQPLATGLDPLSKGRSFDFDLRRL